MTELRYSDKKLGVQDVLRMLCECGQQKMVVRIIIGLNPLSMILFISVVDKQKVQDKIYDILCFHCPRNVYMYRWTVKEFGEHKVVGKKGLPTDRAKSRSSRNIEKELSAS